MPTGVFVCQAKTCISRIFLFIMIRKSTTSLNEANKGKQEQLIELLIENNRVVNAFIDELWEANQFTGSFVKNTNHVESYLSARMKQSASKKALSIVKSQRKKHPDKRTKPTFNKISMELDSRFIKIEFDANSFDIWITLTSLGNKIKLVLPSKKHYHFNKYKDWKLKQSITIRLVDGKLLFDFYFEKYVPISNNSKVKSFDIGYKKLLVDSDGKQYGTEFESICTKISKKKQGSKSFKRALKERDCFINKTIKESGIEECSSIVIEKLRDVKKNSKQDRRMRTKFMNKLQRWVYSKVIARIKLTSEELGVQVLEINPRNTSRTCPVCLTIDKNSRHGERFKCTSCSYENDADFVGALNILKLGLAQDDMIPVTNKTNFI